MSDHTMASRNESIAVGTGESVRTIAAIVLEPAAQGAPFLVWLGGYRSDMSGTKAIELERFARETGCGCLRFDYSGHGQSGGEFRDGTISRWLEESLAVLALTGKAPLVLVGSSMGGWIALRLMQALKAAGRARDVMGLVLIAPAPDFTSELIEPALSDAERASLIERGFFEEPTPYGPDPNIFTAALIEDGRNNRVLSGVIDTGCPVHILQGMKDPDVPYAHALRLVSHLPADNVVLTLISDGDHRLSRPEDIARMRAALEGITRA
ncbi:Pimeloyl-ACP methyl ester carboxylesterase [Rhizobium sp. RU20A]|uniref:alpha/beta hydrolase n=1 Tax=Rhizobium sp. RU20A TaxID=1907412 RepID=UPI00095535EE|nr:alpha/beta hydrolase [Rhizobium sp. RU20A]SIQ74182.1 Pimeloyl-ACP methyl ester carboxylesterase [Rhizobium sp. RU20A]